MLSEDKVKALLEQKENKMVFAKYSEERLYCAGEIKSLKRVLEIE